MTVHNTSSPSNTLCRCNSVLRVARRDRQHPHALRRGEGPAPVSGAPHKHSQGHRRYTGPKGVEYVPTALDTLRNSGPAFGKLSKAVKVFFLASLCSFLITVFPQALEVTIRAYLSTTPFVAAVAEYEDGALLAEGVRVGESLEWGGPNAVGVLIVPLFNLAKCPGGPLVTKSVETQPGLEPTG